MTSSIEIAKNLRSVRRFSSTKRETDGLVLSPKSESLPDTCDIERYKVLSKVNSWLGSTDSGIEFDQSPNVIERFDSIYENDPILRRNDADLNLTPENDVFRRLPDAFQQEVLKSRAILEDVSWPCEQCDLLLQVGPSIFPLQRAFVAGFSGLLRHVIKMTSSDPHNRVIIMNSYDVEEVREALKFIHSNNTNYISGKNVATMLQLSEQFQMEKLRQQCESFLLLSPTFNMIIALQLAKQYSLKTLLEQICVKLSGMEEIETTLEFISLDYSLQNKIMRYALKRFQQAKEKLSNFDVYLCTHHGNQCRDNTCCFRAATYDTKNGHTYLVQKEHPETALMQSFQDGFRNSPYSGKYHW